MTETSAGAPGGQMSDRMQALLSAAAEEQVREQRAVSTVLAELRGQVAALGEGVRAAASDATVERLGGVVSTVVADLRTSTSLLGQRIEALTKRVDAVAADTAAPTEQAAVRLAALAADIAAQGEVVERMSAALNQLAGFPGALAALQKDVAGLHDRLQPLAEVRAAIGDLGARTAHSLEQLRPQINGLQTKLDAIGHVPDTERLRDAVVDALGHRLEKLEQAAARPVVGPEALKGHFGDLRASLDSQTGDRFDEVQAALGALENRLGQLGERVADVADATGGLPAVAAEVARLHTRLDDVSALREQVAKLAQGIAVLQDDSTGTALTLGLASVRDDLQQLEERIAEQVPPSNEDVAGLVSQRVADRLVETLAPRIADVVLTRVSAALVTQLGEALSPRVKADTEDIVRTATADSERRVLAHVDEAVLALAEALLRRRRGARTPEAALQELGGALDEPPARSEPAAAATPDTATPDTATPDTATPDTATPDAAATPAATPAAPAVPIAPQPVAAPPATASAQPAASAHGETAAAEEEPVETVLDRLNAAAEAQEGAPEETPETSPEETPEAAPEPPAAQDRPAVTSSLAPPAPGPVGSEPKATAPAEQPVAEQPKPVTKAGPTSKEPAAREPAKEAPRKVAKAPAKAPLKKAAAPVKKTIRPASKPPAKPMLERTQDVGDDEPRPVRTGAPERPRPLTPQPNRPAMAPPPPQPPPPPPAAPPSTMPPSTMPRPEPKRKPWWRPGG